LLNYCWSKAKGANPQNAYHIRQGETKDVEIKTLVYLPNFIDNIIYIINIDFFYFSA